MHPNEEKPEAEEAEGSTRSRRKIGCCLKTWLKLDEWILRDLLIYNYKPQDRKTQQMFFEMYEDQGEEVATIIKDAAIEMTSGKDDNSNNSGALRGKVQALKRRGTLRKDQLPNVAALQALNSTGDDDYEKAV